MGRRTWGRPEAAAEPPRPPHGQKNRLVDKTVVPEQRPLYTETRAVAARAQQTFDERFRALFEQLALRGVDLQQFIEAMCGREDMADAKLALVLKGAVADPLIALCRKVIELLDENAKLHEAASREVFASHVKSEGGRYLDELTLAFQVTIEERQKLDHAYVAAGDGILEEQTRVERAMAGAADALETVRSATKDLVAHVLDLQSALDNRRLTADELATAEGNLVQQIQACHQASQRYASLYNQYSEARARLKELSGDLQRYDRELAQCQHVLRAFETCLDKMGIPPLTISALETEEDMSALFGTEKKDRAWQRLNKVLPAFPEYKRLGEAAETAAGALQRVRSLLEPRRAASKGPAPLKIHPPDAEPSEPEGVVITPLHLVVCAYRVCCPPHPKTGRIYPMSGRTASVLYRLLADQALTFDCTEEAFLRAVLTAEERGLLQVFEKVRGAGTWRCYVPTEAGVSLAADWLQKFPPDVAFAERVQAAVGALRQQQEASREQYWDRYRKKKGS